MQPWVRMTLALLGCSFIATAIGGTMFSLSFNAYYFPNKPTDWVGIVAFDVALGATAIYLLVAALLGRWNPLRRHK